MLLKVSQTEVDRQKPVDKGLHKFKLMGVTEKANDKKDGTNYTFDFECTASADEKNIGRHAFHMVSSKAIGMGFIPMAAALMNKTVEDFQAGDYEVETLKGRECQIDCQPETYNGNTSIRPKHFYSATFEAAPPY